MLFTLSSLMCQFIVVNDNYEVYEDAMGLCRVP